MDEIEDDADYYCQDDADDEKGYYRKVKREIIFFNEDVAGQFAEKWYVLAEDKKQTKDDDNATDDKKYFT